MRSALPVTFAPTCTAIAIALALRIAAIINAPN